jgi:hypothetical protein
MCMASIDEFAEDGAQLIRSHNKANAHQLYHTYIHLDVPDAVPGFTLHRRFRLPPSAVRMNHERLPRHGL